MAKQELEQSVCQRYGWSAQFRCDNHSSSSSNVNVWSVSVTVGRQDTRTFVGTDSTTRLGCDADTTNSSATKQERKRGMHAAAAKALVGLQERIRQEEDKPEQTLSQYFALHLPLPVYDSSIREQSWQYFWEYPPAVVGIDTEGNQQSPPVLIQIATDEYVILEVPTTNNNNNSRKLSSDLMRLLADDSIVKVFCDNGSQHDKTSLGLSVPSDMTVGAVLDLEALAANVFGPVQVARGLARITTLLLPKPAQPQQQSVRLSKPKRGAERFTDVARFSRIEQGLAPPLQGLQELLSEEQQYAALDAWCTLYAYRRFQEHTSSKDTTTI
jgi:hypothetical protein